MEGMEQFKEKYFAQVPPDYLKGIRIIPHNFDQPENPRHAQYVHDHMRYDLFYAAYSKISKVEEKYLKTDEDYFKLGQIKECSTADSYRQGYITKQYVDEEEDKLLRCEEWHIVHNNRPEIVYRVKTYHSNKDRFYSLVFAPGAIRSVLLWLYGGTI